LPNLLPNCWRSIFNVFAKNQRWQLDLPNCWKCSKWEDFAKLIKMGKSDGELLEKLFLFFPKKLWMRNLDWELELL